MPNGWGCPSKDYPTHENYTMLMGQKTKEENYNTTQTSDPDRNHNDHHEVLPLGPRRTQGNTRVPLVHECPAKNQLEKGMDRSHPTPHNPSSTRCEESYLCAMNSKHTQGNQPGLILHWQSNRHPKNNQRKNRTRGRPPRWVQTPQKGLQWKTITKITGAHNMGPHH